MITSASNEQIKELKKLMKSASRRRELQTYPVEGIRMVREVPPELVQTLYVAESAAEKFRAFCECTEKPVEIVRDSVFDAVSDTRTPQGILATVRMKKTEAHELFAADREPFILIAEHLQDPGNLGTIIRTAEGAGVTGIVLSADTVDLYNPKVVRATMGSIFRVPVYIAEDLPLVIQNLQAHNVCVYGAHLSGASFYERDFTGGCAFLIGNEGNGLSADISRMADVLIRIPMCGRVESLNAAISTAVISYEVLRQRQGS